MKPAKLLLSLVAAILLATPLSAEVPESSVQLLKPFVDRHELAGAVALVADEDKVLSVENVGFADIAAGKPMKADSVFRIASQSKGITAAAVMMLVDEGEISLDDPVEKHLPEFRGQMVIAGKDGDDVELRKPSHPITIREVLSHVSGLPFRSAVEQPTLDALPLADAVKSYAKTLLYPLSDRTRRFPMPAGGLFSTAKDTALFCQMLLNGGKLNGKRYLSEAAFKELTTRQTPMSIPNSYGLGLAVGSDWFGHGGAHATNMQIRPAKGLVMIWMVQHGGFPGEGGKAQGVYKNWAIQRFGK